MNWDGGDRLGDRSPQSEVDHVVGHWLSSLSARAVFAETTVEEVLVVVRLVWLNVFIGTAAYFRFLVPELIEEVMLETVVELMDEFVLLLVLAAGFVGGFERRRGAGLLFRSGEFRSCSAYSARMS